MKSFIRFTILALLFVAGFGIGATATTLPGSPEQGLWADTPATHEVSAALLQATVLATPCLPPGSVAEAPAPCPATQHIRTCACNWAKTNRQNQRHWRRRESSQLAGY
jgi:hypothetical protein